jgi:hypothetical protein
VRVLALILLLVNFGVFAWARWVTPAPAYEAPRALGPDVVRLELVDPPARTAPGSSAWPSGLSGGATGPGAPAHRAAGGADGETSRDETAASPPPLAGTRLVIVAPAEGPGRCARVGPFEELPEAAELAAVLRGRGLDPRQRLLESDVWVGYAVMLEPAPTRSEALRRAGALRDAGLQDIYVEPGGDLRNAISLGLFSDAARAQRRLAEIADLGFDPVIRDRTRTAEVYWVDFEVPPGMRVDLSRFEAPGRRLAPGACGP